jgi:hypothetical protein
VAHGAPLPSFQGWRRHAGCGSGSGRAEPGAIGGGGGLARGVAQAAAASSKAEQLRVVVSAAAGAVRVGSGWRVRAQRGGCSTKLHRHAPVVRACRSRVASRRSSLCRRSDVLLSCYHRTGGRAARRGRRRAKAGGCTCGPTPEELALKLAAGLQSDKDYFWPSLHSCFLLDFF